MFKKGFSTKWKKFRTNKKFSTLTKNNMLINRYILKNSHTLSMNRFPSQSTKQESKNTLNKFLRRGQEWCKEFAPCRKCEIKFIWKLSKEQNKRQ